MTVQYRMGESVRMGRLLYQGDDEQLYAYRNHPQDRMPIAITNRNLNRNRLVRDAHEVTVVPFERLSGAVFQVTLPHAIFEFCAGDNAEVGPLIMKKGVKR